ncbi:MAG: hypothetical protein AMJ79_10150, partial [Phycisphaerae bacterium SM23_30]
ADGAITIETLTENLVITSVSSLTDSDDNDITITAKAFSTSGVTVEVHSIQAAGAGDVIFNVEGTIDIPEGSIIADEIIINTFGDIGSGTKVLTTNASSLSFVITGKGDLYIENTSADLTLEYIELANGSLYVTTHGDLFAKEIILKTDWDATDEPPSANEVVLRTAEGSGGTITVGSIMGGIYADTPEKAAQERLKALNSLLAKIDPIDPDIPAELQDPLTDEDDNPVLDEADEEIIVIQLDLGEAGEFTTIIETAIAASEEEPFVIYEADFVDGLDPYTYITGHVAFLIYTGLLDVLGVAYDASHDADPEWDNAKQERVFSEATDFLMMKKGFSSQGKVTLQADGSITGNGGGAVGIVADAMSLVAKGSIAGLDVAVNTIIQLTSVNNDTISVFDKDGLIDLSPGLELIDAVGGPITVQAEHGLILNDAHSKGPSADLILASTNSSLFVRETGSSLFSEGSLTLSAAGDLTVTGHLVAPELLTFNAGGSLSTFGQEVLLEIGSIAIDAGSTVTLGGHLTGLKGIDIVSAGNVNFLNGVTVQDRKGFNVYVESVAAQQQILQALQDNLQQQAELLRNLTALEIAAVNREIGQDDVLDILGGEYLHQLVRLPYDLQFQQLQLQYGGLQTLLDTQAPLPDVMEDMYLDIGGGELFWYNDLVVERDQHLNDIVVLQDFIDQTYVRILEIDGDVEDLNTELQEVRDAIDQTQLYQQQLAGIISDVEYEIRLRDDFIPSTKPGDPTEVRDLDIIEQVIIPILGQLDNETLGALYNDLMALDNEVYIQLYDLYNQEQCLLTQITENQGEYVTYDLQLQDVQADIVVYEGQLADLDAKIAIRQQAVADMTDFLNQTQYGSKDPLARDLRANYNDLFGPDLQMWLQNLESFPAYTTVEANYSQVYDDLTNVQAVLSILNSLDDIGYEGRDTKLRALDPYIGMYIVSTEADLIIKELEDISLSVTKSGYPPYSDLLDELAYLETQLAQFQTVLDIVTPIVNMLDNPYATYYYFDTELRRLANYGEYVISELWTHIEAITGFNTLLDIDAIISSINTDLNELSDQNTKLAWRYFYQVLKFQGDYDYLEAALQYTDNILIERYGYTPNYKTPRPYSDFYDGIYFDGRSGDFYLPTKPLTWLDWEYFDITSGPYGPGKWALYDMNATLISGLKEQQLLELRADLLVSYGKGNKDGIDGAGEQFGDLALAYYSFPQWASGELDPKWPDNRTDCMAKIQDKETDLALQQQLRSALIGHIDACITRYDGNPSLIEQEETALINEINIINADIAAVEVDIRSLEKILDYAAGDLADLVPTEEQRLLNERSTLYGLLSTYSAQLENMESILDAVNEILPSEQKSLQAEINTLSSQRDDLYVVYQGALAEESQLIATLDGLTTELVGLNQTVGDSQVQIDTHQVRVEELAVMENDMRVQLDGIVAQKWTERTALAAVDFNQQDIEADILSVAQNMVVDQGAAAFGGRAETFRNRMDSETEAIEILSNELDALRSEQVLLEQQLQALQLEAVEPTSIRIEALGYQFPVDAGPFDNVDFQFYVPGFGNNPGPTDGIRVEQDEFSGFFLYENTETNQLLYRDVNGMSEVNDEDVYTEDHNDDTFYTWVVELEYNSGTDTWYYRDIQGTPDDQNDDKVFEVFLVGEAPGAVYPSETSYVVKQLQGTTSQIYYETRLDEEGKEEQYPVTIISDLFSVHDYHYSVLVATADVGGPTPIDPDFNWDTASFYVLDATTLQAISLADVLLRDEGVVWDDAIILGPGETLEDLGVTELDREDILITFTEYTPAYTPLSLSEFTFINPVDYTDTVFGPDEALPELYTQLLHNGQLVIPVVDLEDGKVNLEKISLSGSESITIIAPRGIKGLDFGEAFTAKQVYIQSEADLTLSGSLVGIDLVEIQTEGNLYLQTGAFVEAETVNFISEFGSVFGAEGSLICGTTFAIETSGDIFAYADFDFYDVAVFGAGNVAIYDSNARGRDKTVDLTDVHAAVGTVTVMADNTIRAFYVGANDINLVAEGESSIEVGMLETWGSTVTLDAARYVRDIEGMTSNVMAENVLINAGLDITVLSQFWSVETLETFGNLSVLIDEYYQGPLQIEAERDIIIDTIITAGGEVNFTARNIIFTENGAINNSGGSILLKAEENMQFSETRTFGGANTPTIQGAKVTIEAKNVWQGEKALVSGDVLFVTSETGFGLRTEVGQLHAAVLGAGDLQINSLSSVELANVDVFNGDFEVKSGGSIIARDVVIATDSYANKLDFSAAGSISFNGVQIGQLVELNIEAGTGFAGIDYGLVVTPAFVDDVVYEGETANIHIEVTDPSYQYRPDSNEIDILVDFGDGGPAQTITTPYILPDPEMWQDPAQVFEGFEGIGAPGWNIRASAGAGDVNNDGYDDLVVGQTSYDSFGNEIGGRILLYLGTQNGLETQPVTIIQGTQPDGGFGKLVAAAGDVNADGYDDVIVGAPYQLVTVWKTVVNLDGTVVQVSEIVQGQLLLYFGGPDGLYQMPAWSRAGFESFGLIQYSVSSAGDVNNDGFDDVLVGVPAADVVQIDEPDVITLIRAGKAQLYLGSEDGLTENPVWTYFGNKTDGLFGTAVSSLGDLNDDGFDDVIIGACNEGGEEGEWGNGFVYLFLGSAGGLSPLPDQVVAGEQKGHWLGWDAVGAGDVNNDGYPDMIAAAPWYSSDTIHYPGAVYLYFGSADGFTQEPYFVDVPEEAMDQWFGWDLANAGDVNADGYSDFLALAAKTDTQGNSVGQAFLYLGSATGVSSMVVQFPQGTSATTDFFDVPGTIDGTADFNDDGAYDVVLGDWTTGYNGGLGTVAIYEGGAFNYPAPIVALAGTQHVYSTYGYFTVTASVVSPEGTGIFGSVSGSIEGFPVAQDDIVVTDEDTTLLITSSELLNNDWDPDLGDSLFIIDIDTTGIKGVLVDFGQNIYIYNPNGQFEYLGIGESATDTFWYSVTDGYAQTGGNNTAEVTVTINGVNDAPTAVPDRVFTDEDTAVIITASSLLINDMDPDVNDSFSIVGIDTTDTLGLVIDNGDGTYTYDPNGRFEYLGLGQTAIDVFTYIMQDNGGALDTTTVEVEINAVLPTVADWMLSDDTGSDPTDKLTKDTTPILRFTFSEVVLGEDSDITILDPDSDEIMSDSITGWGTKELIITLSTPLLVDGPYTVILSGQNTIRDQGGNLLNQGADEIVTFILDTIKPQIDSITINGNQIQRSNITDLRISFDSGTNIGYLIADETIDQYIEIYSLLTPGTPLPWLDESRFVWDSQLNVLTIDMTIDSWGGSDLTTLANGYFVVRVNTTQTDDMAGNDLLDNDGLTDGWLIIDRSTGSVSQDLFRLECDTNGDGLVNENDFAIWQQNYDPLGLNDNTPGMGDWNLDNRIDGRDAALWQQSYNTTGLPPVVSYVGINGGANQRSNITDLTLRFSKDMNLDTLIAVGAVVDYIKLYDKSDLNAPLAGLTALHFAWDDITDTLIVDLTSDGIGGSQQTHLSDGRYEIRINTAAITDLVGNDLVDNDGQIDGWLIIDHSTVSSEQDFFRLECDANGDAKVDGDDLALWQQNYDPLGLNDNTPGMGDWNLDGCIDGADLALWQQRYDSSELPVPLPPTVYSVVLNEGESQRSNVTSLALQFDKAMYIDELITGGAIDDHIKLYDLSAPDNPLAWLDETYFDWNDSTNTLKIDLTIDGFGSSLLTHLANGRYEIRIDTSEIKDLAGYKLLDTDGQADGYLTIDRSTGAVSQDFFRLLCDANGDAEVDEADLALWQQNYDPLGVNDNTPGMGDWNLDAKVDGDDIALWQQNYNEVPLPPQDGASSSAGETPISEDQTPAPPDETTLWRDQT